MNSGQTRTKAALALAVVFAAGAVVGLAAKHFYVGALGPQPGSLTPAKYRAHLLEQLTEDLDLDPEQQLQIESILDEIGERFRSVREAIEPELEAIRAERADRVMSVLDQAQQAKYTRILEERRRRREAREARYHGMPRSP
jgi:Spy/CpxP family protein refolding chaperone